MPRHSVILSSYNRPKLIQLALDSVFSQTIQDFEVIVTDDGSNEETLGAIRSRIDKDPRAKLLTIEGREITAHSHLVNRAIDRINEALKSASGAIIHYLSDDDLYDAKRFEIFEALFAAPEVMVGYGRLLYIDQAGKIRQESRYFPVVGDPYRKLDHNQFAHRRETMKMVPSWEYAPSPHFAGDAYYMRALSKHWEFIGVDRIVAYKREHKFNMLRTRSGSRGVRE